MSKSLRCKLAFRTFVLTIPAGDTSDMFLSQRRPAARDIIRLRNHSFGDLAKNSTQVWCWGTAGVLHMKLNLPKLPTLLWVWITTGHCNYPNKNGKLGRCDVQLLNMTNWPTSVVPMTLPFPQLTWQIERLESDFLKNICHSQDLSTLYTWNSLYRFTG